MSCKAVQTETTVCYSTDSCIVCRDDGKTQRLVNLTPGFEYPECSAVVWVDGDDCRAVVPLELDEEGNFDMSAIAGVITCYQNLVDVAETDVCEAKILCGAVFDVKMMHWPEGMTKAQLDCLMTRSTKPCFVCREGCIELPEEYAGAAK